MTARIRIVLGEGARLPTRATPGSAGLDLYASRDTWVPAGECVVVPTGVRLEIPPGYEGQVRGRSGLTRAGVIVHLGTLDADYRGEIGVITSLAPWADQDDVPGQWKTGMHVEAGARIAQLVIAPVWCGELEVTDTLTDTERGAGGFGSTGA
jgi:dUTP pyrophosphatase